MIFGLLLALAITQKFSVYPDACIPLKDFYRMRYVITEKMDDHKYLMIPTGDPLFSQKPAILRTVKLTFQRKEVLRIPMMKHVGEIKLQMQDGFERLVDVWDTCTCKDGKTSETNYCPEDHASTPFTDIR